MLRGTTLFKCTKCKKRFFAPDFEYLATTLSAPQPCPRCNSLRTRPSRLVGGSDFFYKRIWEQMEKNE